MKKIFLMTTGFILLAMTAQAQTRATQHVVYGEHQADITLEEVNQNEANLYVSNPKGSEQAVVNIKRTESNDVIETTVYDQNTGKQLAHLSAKEGEYIDSVQQMGDTSHEIHLKKTGPGDKDLSGTIKYSGKDESIDFQFSNGQVVGTFSQVENGIKTEITIMSDGSMQAVYSDYQTKEVLYKVVGTQDYTYLYDKDGHLIAEGTEDAPKIYDKKAYEEFKKITDEEDDI